MFSGGRKENCVDDPMGEPTCQVTLPVLLGFQCVEVTGYGARKGQYLVASPPVGPAPALLLLVTPARTADLPQARNAP